MRKPLLMCALLALSLAWSGCSGGEQSVEESSSSSLPEESSSSVPEPEPEPEPEPFKLTFPEGDRVQFEAAVKDVAEKALDPLGKVILWLNVPNTTIQAPVVWYADDGNYAPAHQEPYFSRKDIYGNFSFEGCFSANFHSDIKSGKPDEMPQNLLVYGTHLGNPQGVTNDPNGIGFAPLLQFRERDFAEKTPYLFVTTENADLVYQVFAVSDVEQDLDAPLSCYNAAFEGPYYIWDDAGNYEQHEFEQGDFLNMVNGMRDRSYWDYSDVSVTADDKILTLSTSVYDYGTYSQVPNQSFVVMARLVRDLELPDLTETAVIEENTDRKLPKYAPTEMK